MYVSTPVSDEFTVTGTAYCDWERDEHTGAYETSCGNAFEITDGTPDDNGMTYCCFCGNRIRENAI